MLTTQTKDLLRHLRRGERDPAVESIEGIAAKDLLSELSAVYRVSFQERHLRNKWERGLARSLSMELRKFQGTNVVFPIFMLVPVLRDCLLLSGEGETVTGIAALNRLTLRPIMKPNRGVALTTGNGLQLDKLPDGWIIKPMRKRTTRFTTEVLQKRGWRFEALDPFLSGNINGG